MFAPVSYHPRWLATVSCPELEGLELGGLEGVELLGAVFRDGRIRIVKAPDYTPDGEGTRVYISSNRFSEADTEDEAKAIQSELIEVINGYCQFVWPGFPRVESNLLIELGRNGSVEGRYLTTGPPDLTVLQSGDPVLDILYADEGAPRGKLSPIPENVAGALFEAPVRRALAFLGKRAPSWNEMYAALGVIENDIGGSVDDQEWSTAADRTLFRRTAQHPETAGVEARHGAPTTEPPKEPMSLRDARDWIRELLAKWIRSKANQT